MKIKKSIFSESIERGFHLNKPLKWYQLRELRGLERLSFNKNKTNILMNKEFIIQILLLNSNTHRFLLIHTQNEHLSLIER